MKQQIFAKWKKITFVCMISFGLLGLNGCALYDSFVKFIQSVFSTTKDYEVSVVECKNLAHPDQIISITPKLSGQLSENVREGVRSVSQDPKFRNIRLVDKIPKEKFAEFQDAFFTDEKSPGKRIELLRNYSETYHTNIVIWGATMGDDSGIAFIGWLYRRDLDVITTSVPQKFTEKMSDLDKESAVEKAVRNLLIKSLEDKPLNPGDEIAGVLIDNKKEILTATQAALAYLLQSLL